jgi:hypothetical protein
MRGALGVTLLQQHMQRLGGSAELGGKVGDTFSEILCKYIHRQAALLYIPTAHTEQGKEYAREYANNTPFLIIFKTIGDIALPNHAETADKTTN